MLFVPSLLLFFISFKWFSSFLFDLYFFLSFFLSFFSYLFFCSFLFLWAQCDASKLCIAFDILYLLFRYPWETKNRKKKATTKTCVGKPPKSPNKQSTKLESNNQTSDTNNKPLQSINSIADLLRPRPKHQSNTLQKVCLYCTDPPPAFPFQNIVFCIWSRVLLGLSGKPALLLLHHRITIPKKAYNQFQLEFKRSPFSLHPILRKH